MKQKFYSTLWGAALLGILLSLFAYLCSYMGNIILAHTLTVHEYGVYSSTIFMLTILSCFCLFGFDEALLQYFPNYIEDKKWRFMNGYLRFFTNKILSYNVVFILLALVGILLAEHLSLLNQTHHSLWVWYLWFLPILALVFFFGAYFESIGYGKLALLVETVVPPFLFLGLVGILWLSHPVFSLKIFLLLFLISNFLTVIFGFFLGYFLSPKSIFNIAPLYEKKAWFKTAIELNIVTIVSEYLGAIVLITSFWFAKSSSEPGLLMAIITVCALLWVINTGVALIITPGISAAAVKKDQRRLRSLFKQGVIFNFIPTAIFIFIIGCYGKFWLQHFGAEYVIAYPALLVVSIGVGVNVILSPAFWIAEYSENLQQVTWLSILWFVILVVASAIGAHYWGLMGSALSYAAIRVLRPISWLVLVLKSKLLG